MTEFVDTVRDIAMANEGTVTAAEFAKAGRLAGIVAQPTKKATVPEVSKTETPRQPVMIAFNAILPAVRDAIELEVNFTKTQRKNFAGLADLLITLAGDAA